MQVVGLRGSPLNEEEGNVGDSAVIGEVFEGVRPDEHTESAEDLEDQTYSQEHSTGEEV